MRLLPLIITSFFLLSACSGIMNIDNDTATGDDPTPNLSPWPQGSVPSNYSSTGVFRGDYAPDFHAVDQFGDPIRLGQFWGSVVLLDFSAIWCPPCRSAASGVQNLANDLSSYPIDFWYITVLIDDEVNGGGLTDEGYATVEDAQIWASTYGIVDQPIFTGRFAYLADSTWVVTSLPTFVLLDRDFYIIERIHGYPGDAYLKSLIEQYLSR